MWKKQLIHQLWHGARLPLPTTERHAGDEAWYVSFSMLHTAWIKPVKSEHSVSKADRPCQSCHIASPMCHIFETKYLTTVTQHCNTPYNALYTTMDLGCCIGNASHIPGHVPDETCQGIHSLICAPHAMCTHLLFEVFLQLIDAHSQVEVQLHGTILHLHIPAHSSC